jgi:hypothetical protein
MTTEIERRQKIAALNDAFRRSFSGGKLMLTVSIAALPSHVKATILCKVATFAEFTADNDPHGEHDFGSFEVADHHVFWKIDYYDEHMEFGSEDPADPRKTTRVLTIMLAEDY